MKQFNFSKHHLWIVSALFLLIALVFTFPLIANITSVVPGVGLDSYQFPWGLWHMQHALKTGGNPFETSMMYSPLTINLLLHTFTPVKVFLAQPLLWFADSIVSYNILFIATFVIKAVGMYLLMLTFLSDKRLAFLSGIIYAFAPYFLVHGLGHFQILSSEAIPWIGWLWRINKTKPHIGKIVVMGVLLAYLFFCDIQTFIFLGFFAFLFWVYQAWGSRKNALSCGLVMFKTVCIFAICLLPYIIMLALQLHEYDLKNMHSGGWGGAEYFSIDLLSMFVPSELHPLWGKFIQGLIEKLQLTGSQIRGSNIAERTVFLGFTVYVAILLQWKKLWADRRMRFLLITSFVFFIFALGPYISLKGMYLNHIKKMLFFYFDSIAVTFPAPYTLIHYLPVLNGLRQPSRFMVMPIFMLAILCPVALNYLMQAIRGREKIKKLIPLLAIGLVLFEFLPAPYPLVKNNVPKVYDIIKADKDVEHVVLDLPSSPWIYNLSNFRYQIYHGHKIVGGFTSRDTYTQLEYAEKTAVLKKICLEDETVEAHAFREVLLNYKVKYLVIRGKKRVALVETMSAAIPELANVVQYENEENTALWIIK